MSGRAALLFQWLRFEPPNKNNRVCHEIVSWVCHEGSSMLRYPRVMGGEGTPAPLRSPFRAWAGIPPKSSFFDMRTKAQVDRHMRVYMGGRVDSPEPAGATQRHTLIFLCARNWSSDLPSYMTLIPLQSGSKRAIALASPATLISLQSAQIAGERDSTIALCKTDSRALGCCYEEQGQRKSQQREVQAAEPR